MNHQFSQPTRPATKTPRWQIGLLLLMLLSFLGASYALLRPIPAANQLPPVLYLAEDEAGQLQLFIATAPNWQATQLTQETAVLLNYAASPDGSQIVYATSLPDGSSQLKRLPLNNNLAPGTPETLITCEIAECAQPVWHPDGRRLLYERREPPNFSRPQLWWLDTQTGETRLLLEKETAVGSSASFSPDGSWVAFAASPDEGLRLYNFTDGRSLVFASDLGTAVAWHPFQNQLLYQNRRAVFFHDEDDDNLVEDPIDARTDIRLAALRARAAGGRRAPRARSGLDVRADAGGLVPVVAAARANLARLVRTVSRVSVLPAALVCLAVARGPSRLVRRPRPCRPTTPPPHGRPRGLPRSRPHHAHEGVRDRIVRRHRARSDRRHVVARRRQQGVRLRVFGDRIRDPSTRA